MDHGIMIGRRKIVAGPLDIDQEPLSVKRSSRSGQLRTPTEDSVLLIRGLKVWHTADFGRMIVIQISEARVLSGCLVSREMPHAMSRSPHSMSAVHTTTEQLQG